MNNLSNSKKESNIIDWIKSQKPYDFMKHAKFFGCQPSLEKDGPVDLFVKTIDIVVYWGLFMVEWSLNLTRDIMGKMRMRYSKMKKSAIIVSKL